MEKPEMIDCRRHLGLVAGVFAVACAHAVVCGQESAGRVSAPEVPKPETANPVPPQAPNRAVPSQSPQTPETGDEGLRAVPAATPANSNPDWLPPTTLPQQVQGMPEGTSVSGQKMLTTMIEETTPERVPVFPDDPKSAWWEVNPRYAFARAQREYKPLMLLFTAIWETKSMALSEQVFATKSFNDYVKENLVICYLDYPRNFKDAPDWKRNIKDKFNVKGYPNVLLFNPNGEVVRGVTGYRTGRPVDYFTELKTICIPLLDKIESQKQQLMRRGFRDWSNYQGKVVFARFVRRDDTLVTLRDVSGYDWTIKINDLAPDDQRLVESFPVVEKIPAE